MRARVVLATALLALAAAPPAHAGGKPDGRELWRAYPLAPKSSATPTATSRPAATPSRTAAAPARHPADAGGGSAFVPIAVVVLAAAALGVTAATLRRRRRGAAATSAEPAAAPPPPTRVRDARTAERLRAAVDMQRGREWPWPAGSDGLWRCEIGPDQAALSARFRAVLQPPDGEPARVLAVSSSGPASGDWQSAAPLERAVNGLAAQLVADGWEPVDGTGDPHTRRFCWRHDAAPHIHLEETAWSA